MRFADRFSGRLVLAFIVFGAIAGTAQAQVVAFGASQISGRGVESGNSYPAQLEVMLKAKGYAVSIDNEGASDDTTSDMLNRLDAAIPPGTKVVILDTSGGYANDYRRGITHTQGKSDIDAITTRLKNRGVKVIQESTADLPKKYRQEDGLHLTAEGHRLVAERLLPEVIQALGPAH